MREYSISPRRNIATIVAHTIFIVMLFVLPELVMNIANPHRSQWGFYPGFYLKMLFFLAVFYVNYFYLVDRELGQQRPRIMKFVLLNVGIVVVALTLNYTIGSALYETHHPRRWHRMSEMQKLAGMTSFYLRDAVMMVLAIGLAAAMRLSTRWADIQLQRQRLLSAQRQSELESLKSQLNPHFLFNTLNSIYALIDINADDARSAVHRLSGMLRYMLYEDNPEVTLRCEAEFISNYVDLMKLRLRVCDHPVVIDIDIPQGPTVPPLIFIPLVENALKYGIGGRPGVPVEIVLGVRDRRVICRTSNSFDSSASKKDKGGIGLANLRRRLVLIYGDKASLRTNISGDCYTSELSLPLNVSNNK